MPMQKEDRNRTAQYISNCSTSALQLPSLDVLKQCVNEETANSYGYVCQYLHKLKSGQANDFLKRRIGPSLKVLRKALGPTAPQHGIQSSLEGDNWLQCLRTWQPVVLAGQQQEKAATIAKAQAPGILRFWSELSRLQDLRAFANSEKAQTLPLADVQQSLPALGDCEEAVLVVCRETGRNKRSKDDDLYSPVVAVWLYKQINGELAPNESAQLIINHEEFFDQDTGEPRSNMEIESITSWIALADPPAFGKGADKPQTPADADAAIDPEPAKTSPTWAEFIARWDKLTAHWIEGSGGLAGLCLSLRGPGATAFTLRLVDAKDVHASPHTALLESAMVKLDKHPLLKRSLEQIVSAAPHARLDLSTMQHENFVGHMDTCKEGKRSRAFPLDPTQRMAAIAVSELAFSKESELLPINGPPGTGKTSFLRAALASNWVRSALDKADHPPIVYGVAATNQAVSNMIEAFCAIKSTLPDGPAYPWLDDLSSYGWFFPAKMEAQKRKDLMLLEWSDAKRTPFSISGQATAFGEREPKEHQSLLMERACRVLGLDPTDATLEQVTERTYARLHDVFRELQNKQRGYQKDFADAASAWRSATGSLRQLRVHESDLDALCIQQRARERHFELVRIALETSELLLHQETWLEASWRALLPKCLRQWLWGREIKDLADLRHRAAIALKPLSRTLHTDLPSLRLTVQQLQSESDGLSTKIETGASQVTGQERKVYDLRKQREARRASLDDLFQLADLASGLDTTDPKGAGDRYKLRQRLLRSFSREAGKSAHEPLLPDATWIHCLEAPLDTQLRVEMFHWAARYWECRWLKAELLQGAANDAQRIERLMMLGVIIVATTHKVIRLGQSRVADLLIMDEAGQCLPEIAAACLTLSRNAAFVGDTLQLQPVAKVSAEMQKSIASKACPNEILPPEVMPLSGSGMKIAQLAARCSSGDDPGITLLFHYRCVPDIIGYCNALLYKGRIQNARVEPRMAQLGWMPSMSWVAVDGTPERAGGSWTNANEVEAIVNWLVIERTRLTEVPASGGKPAKTLALADVVAIVTPLKRQAALLREALEKAFGEEEVARMVIGTVHKLQGAERPVVLFTLVQSQPTNQRLMADRDGGMLMNVAVSRARDAFVVFADRNTLKPAPQDAVRERQQATPEPIAFLGQYLRTYGERLYPTALVIVEAQGKVKKVQMVLGPRVAVLATHGTLRHASLSDEGLQWSESPSEWVAKLHAHAGLVRDVLIATDDDLAGELIGMHAADDAASVFSESMARGRRVAVKRMRFSDMSEESLNKAFASAGPNFDGQRLAAAVVREFANLIDVRIYQDAGLPLSGYASAQVRDSVAWLGEEWQKSGGQEHANKREVWCTFRTPAGDELQGFVPADTGALAKPLVLEQSAAEHLAQTLMEFPDLRPVAMREVLQLPGLYPANTTPRVLAMAVDELGLDVQIAQKHMNALYLQGAEPGDSNDKRD